MKREVQHGEADLTNVNLAYILSDAQKIYIPSIKDKEIYDSNKSGLKPVIIDGAQQDSGNAQEKVIVNINTANEEELQKIPGIGETIAKRIVTYRKQNGIFKTIEDIQNVSGIGSSKFNKIKEYICVK